MRIAYFCMESAFSVRPLEALCEAGHDVALVIRPIGGTETRKTPVLKRYPSIGLRLRSLLVKTQHEAPGVLRDPFVVAAAKEIPTYVVGDASQPALLALLRQANVDLIVVAFFNQLLRAELLSIPRLGGINMHPSMLPLYRGPAPIFWMYRDGVQRFGLTTHRLAPGEDDGDVVVQTPIDIELGLAGEDLIDVLAEQAAVDVVAAVQRVEQQGFCGRAQDHAAQTRAPRPMPADLVVDARFECARAFHFVRGVGRFNETRVLVGPRLVRVVDALGYEPGSSLPGDAALIGDVLHLPCVDGVTMFRAQPNV